ncbi:MAG: hypothetical protein ABDH28_04090 [Brevinematia bacterium]
MEKSRKYPNLIKYINHPFKASIYNKFQLRLVIRSILSLLFLSLLSSSFGKVKHLKYTFSVMGIRAGEATVSVVRNESNLIVTSKVKTYPGLKLVVDVDDIVKSYIELPSLRTLRRDTLSVGGSFKDTNSVIFDREKKDIVIESVVFGKIYIHNTNDSINDLVTEVLKVTHWDSVPTEVKLNFLEVTNTRPITLQRHKGNKFTIKEIKDAYIEITNIGGNYTFSKADIPIFYLFPFGNIGLSVELVKVKFEE